MSWSGWTNSVGLGWALLKREGSTRKRWVGLWTNRTGLWGDTDGQLPKCRVGGVSIPYCAVEYLAACSVFSFGVLDRQVGRLGFG